MLGRNRPSYMARATRLRALKMERPYENIHLVSFLSALADLKYACLLSVVQALAPFRLQ
jgi:hypothetical protein